MQPRRIRREENRLAVLRVKIPVGAHGHLTDAVDLGMDEGVGTEMFGHANLARPGAFRCGNADMFRADAKGCRTVLGGFRTFDEVHARRADEPGDKHVLRVEDMRGVLDLLVDHGFFLPVHFQGKGDVAIDVRNDRGGSK
eukprot:gene3494-4354_t